MVDTIKGYFSNHQLSANDFQSLQNSPDNFRPHFTLKEAIIDFLRKIFSLETKSHALTDLNNQIHESHLAHNPVELLEIFDKILPDNLKSDIDFFIHYENYNTNKKITSIEITCRDAFFKIEPEMCWLNERSKEMIEKSTFNTSEVNHKAGNESYCYSVNNCEEKQNPITRTYLIKNELIKLMDECLISSDNKRNYNAIMHVNVYTCIPERFCFRINGDFRLDIPLKKGKEIEENHLIIATYAECIDKIKTKSENVNSETLQISNYYTSCQYSEALKVFGIIDNKIKNILDGNDYLHEDRLKRRYYIDQILKEIKKLEPLLSINDIICREGSNVTIINILKHMLTEGQLLYDNEIGIIFDREKAESISSDLSKIKDIIINSKFITDDLKKETKRSPIIINKLKEENPFIEKELKIEEERRSKIINNIQDLVEYCKKK